MQCEDPHLVQHRGLRVARPVVLPHAANIARLLENDDVVPHLAQALGRDCTNRSTNGQNPLQSHITATTNALMPAAPPPTMPTRICGLSDMARLSK
jgi:hypothetical protein